MKKIMCEMCEGTEFVKEDGLFVCQDCGCKYTPEEAKKLMVETEAGENVQNKTPKKNDVVQEENSDAAKIKTLLTLAQMDLDTYRTEDAIEKCNQVLLTEPSNQDAWLLRLKANLDVKIALGALEACPDIEFKKKVIQLYEKRYLDEPITTLKDILARAQMLIQIDHTLTERFIAKSLKRTQEYSKKASERTYGEFAKECATEPSRRTCNSDQLCLARSINGGYFLIDAEKAEELVNFCKEHEIAVVEDIRAVCEEWESFLFRIQQLQCWYGTYRGREDGVAVYYHNKGRFLEGKSLDRARDTEKAVNKTLKKCDDLQRVFIRKYWENHPEEKKKLSEQHSELLSKINSLKKNRDQSELLKERKELRKKRELLQLDQSHCGLFEGKKRKEIKEQIAQIDDKIQALDKEYGRFEEKTNKEIKTLEEKAREIAEKLTGKSQ